MDSSNAAGDSLGNLGHKDTRDNTQNTDYNNEPSECQNFTETLHELITTKDIRCIKEDVTDEIKQKKNGDCIKVATEADENEDVTVNPLTCERSSEMACEHEISLRSTDNSPSAPENERLEIVCQKIPIETAIETTCSTLNDTDGKLQGNVEQTKYDLYCLCQPFMHLIHNGREKEKTRKLKQKNFDKECSEEMSEIVKVSTNSTLLSSAANTRGSDDYLIMQENYLNEKENEGCLFWPFVHMVYKARYRMTEKDNDKQIESKDKFLRKQMKRNRSIPKELRDRNIKIYQKNVVL